MTQEIKLPPLPEARIVSYTTDSAMRCMELRTYGEQDMQAYATAAIKADRQETQNQLSEIYELFGIGSAARELHILFENIKNAKRRSDCLNAVECEFFMVPGEPDEDYPDDPPNDECLLSWGAEIDDYVEQFRAALDKLFADRQPNENLSIKDYEEVLADHRRLVRELDVLLNGEEGAAKQASLCDIVAQVRRDRQARGEQVKMQNDSEDDIVGLLSEYACHNTEHGRMSFDKWSLREAVSALLAKHTTPQPQVSEPTLEAPAQVGNVRFGKGIKWSTVIGAAQRHYVYMTAPQKEQERIRKAAEFVKRIQEGTEPQPQQIPEGYKLVPQRLISLCEQVTKWRNCMSYNDSYFGEPDGDLKRIAAEMERTMLEAAPEPKGEV